MARISRMLMAGLALAAATLGSAEAKIVGLVFDDSGSMVPTQNLPLFGAQLLAASLDGRPNQDRFLAIRLSAFQARFPGRKGVPYAPILPDGMKSANIDPGAIQRIMTVAPNLVERLDITPGRSLQDTIERIRSWPILRTTDTPYEPVEIMLSALARETRPGEDAHLVIISDGSFYDNRAGMMPDRTRLLANYRSWKQQIKGNLSVHFLLIKNGGEKDRTTLEHQVIDQGVISGLMEVFTPTSRSFPVDGFDDLKSSMIEIMARVSATDRDRTSAVVKRSGNTVELNAPFSVSRIITAGIEELPGRAPQPLSIDGVQPAGRIAAEVRMSGPDTLERWPKKVLVGDVHQFLFDEALPRGRHIIRFEQNQNVGSNVELLFRSDISLGWNLRNQEGTTLFRSRDNPKTPGEASAVPVGRPLRLDVDVFDRLANQMADLKGFPADAVFEYSVSGPNAGDQPFRPMSLSPDGSSFTAPVRFDRVGSHSIRVRMRIPGFVTTENAAVTVNADERSVRFDTAVEPQGQLDRHYHRDQNQTVLTPQAGRQPPGTVARVIITPREAPSGRLLVTANGLPSGIDARINNQPVASDGVELPFRRDEPIVIVLQRTNDYTGIAGGEAERREINITARPREPQEGSASVAMRVEPIVAKPRLSFENGNESIELVDLEAGRASVKLRVEDPLVQGPIPPAYFKAEITGPWTARWIDLKVQNAGDRNEIGLSVGFPRRPLCCLIGLFGLGEHRIEAVYQRPDGMTAQAMIALTIEDNGRWTKWYCWVTFGLLALILYILGVFWYWWNAVSFPKNSSLMFERDGNNMPDREPLRRGPSFAIFKALAWPIYFFWWRTTITQRFSKSQLDLVFEANSPDSTLIWPKGDEWPPFTLNSQPLKDQGGGKDGNPIDPLEMNYGDQYGDSLVEQRSDGLVVTLVRDHREFPGNWSRYRRRR